MNIAKERAIELAMSNLMAVFNERDQSRREEAIRKTYSLNVTLYQPGDSVTGHQAVDQLCEKLLGASPDFSFKPTGPVKANHNMITMPWSFGPPENPGKITGSDVMLVDEDNLISVLYVIIDAVATLTPDPAS